MDLEDELRQAMADHVTELSAPGDLAAGAKRRHHRTVRRRAAFAVGAAGVIVAAGMIPAYNTIHPQTVGADGPEGRKQGQQTTRTLSTSPTPSTDAPSSSPGAGPKGSHPAGRPTRQSDDTRNPGLGTVKALLTYLPHGLTAKPCTTEHTGTKDTKTCRWSGSSGWIEVRLVHGKGLKSPSDLKLAPVVAKAFRVHGHQGLRADGPALPNQIMWIERQGLGVWVGVSPSLGGSMTRIAEGVNVT
ncbi:hypothetical protein [Actinoallomurus iriomotensis]|uniref:Uncharacterized protein n=1 Tax=Actinoallomurus iriomotensis TaxID=478107 RepID=A0A9W6RIY0_9ACTN|nr:hypothetical protein [Actinoallomurus iriomotensis]GLY76578.1 hypothetical protein Airi01_048450 [Actinoallomurus iriomotensis]